MGTNSTIYFALHSGTIGQLTKYLIIARQSLVSLFVQHVYVYFDKSVCFKGVSMGTSLYVQLQADPTVYFVSTPIVAFGL